MAASVHRFKDGLSFVGPASTSMCCTEHHCIASCGQQVTSWQEEPFPAVILRNGEILRDGDPLNAGGGFVPDAELGLNIGDDLAARSFECDEAVGTEMLNNDLTTWIEGPSVLPAHQGCSRSASRGVAVRGIRRLRLRCWT